MPTITHTNETSPSYFQNDSGIKPEFTFDTFLVNPFDSPCLSACRSVTNRPAGTYNPLFIHGPTGSGKTHLAHAVANTLSSSNHMQILCKSGAAFTHDLIDSLRHGCTNEFREQYLRADILLIDGIDYIADKERTSSEFLHLLDALLLRNVQVILTANSAPAQHGYRNKELLSRLCSGLITRTSYPEEQIKIAFVTRRMAAHGLQADSAIAKLLASRMTGIRELQGAVNTLIATAPRQSMDLACAQSLLSDHLGLSDTPTIPSDKDAEQVATWVKDFGDDIAEHDKQLRQESLNPLPAQYDDETADISTPLGLLKLPEWVNGYRHASEESYFEGNLTHLLFPRFTVHWHLDTDANHPLNPKFGAFYPLDEDSESCLNEPDNDTHWRRETAFELEGWIAIPLNDTNTEEATQ